ncbi:MAG: SDR family oxidoreductase [Actinomycetota bacterium]|nr:SDR family oxidoreductase [Actinomycetota bacterium]
MGDLDARAVAITGGARGIGRAIASQLAAGGARVAIGDMDLETAERTAAELGDAVHALHVDVTDRSSVDAFVDGAEELVGPLDVFVNNAGILLVGPFLEEDDGATAKQIAVNLMGVIHGMRAVLPRMRDRGRGQVVNVASSASWVGPPGEATYGATKHAVLGLTDAVREEMDGTGVVLTGVYPGLVDTELAKGTQPPRTTKWISPDQVAEAVVGAIREPRTDVFVPRDLNLTLRFARAAPTRLRHRFVRSLDLNRVTATTSPAERAGYMKRIGLDPQAAGRGTSRDDA